MNRRINLRQLEAFREVMLTGRVTSAADRMGVSQPAVSKLISEFETNLGAQLFSRSNTGLQPTATAHKLFDESEKVHASLSRFVDFSNLAVRQDRDLIKVGAIPIYADTIAPKMIAAFYERYPDTFCMLESLAHDELVRALQNGEIDAALTTVPTGAPSFSEHDLFVEPAVVVMPADHALAGASEVSLAQLRKEKLVTLPPSSPFQQALDSRFAEDGFDPFVVMHARTQVSIVSLVRRGVGVAILCGTIHEYFGDNLAVARLKEGYGWKSGLAANKDTANSLMIDRFVTIAQSVCAMAPPHTDAVAV
ncbi:MAG: LysR family transcriptional regulator [Hyphococcus sp.]